jgi:L-lactate dehydrogenase complex protein LldF
MHPTSRTFPENARVGLADPTLQRALGLARTGFPLRRRQAIDRLPEFEALRDQGKAIKDHTLAHLDYYLERYEQNVTAAGGQVHWARTAEEARAAILQICRSVGAKIVTKGKSMVAEEIALNDYLEANWITPVETDLGEYIIQLRHEPPSHIIAPAIHLMKEQVADAFRAAHTELPPDRPLGEPSALCEEARTILRPQFLAADVGITGANFLVAETGSSIIVTNEGNGDLTQTLPRIHIVMASLEKIVPTLEDAATLLRLLARSATGQEFSSYTTMSTGPRRPDDRDGPEQYHVILLDNGRTAMLGTEFQDMLRCLRCSACLNHCPVYAAVGGHAYGWVYPGPMGAVLTPALLGVGEAGHLPNASTFCGRCESVCPVKIPLPKMMRHWRERQFAEKKAPATQRTGLRLWAWIARRPTLYHALAEIGSRMLGWAGGARGRFRALPFAAGWTSVRDMPAPEGRSFHSLWAERQRRTVRSGAA